MKRLVLIIHNSGKSVAGFPMVPEVVSAYKSGLSKSYWKLHMELSQWELYYTFDFLAPCC